MDLTFVPRNVSRKQPSTNPLPTTLRAPAVTLEPPPEPKRTPPLEDHVVLTYLRLAFSDYALSLDENLKRTVQWNLRENEGCEFPLM